MKKLYLTLAFTAGLIFSGFVYGQTTTYRSSNTANTTGGTLSITKPTGLAVNDLMIASIAQGENGSGSLANATASGWTLVQGTSFGASGNTSRQATVLYKVATAADVSATSFSFTVSNPGTDKAAGIVAAFYNVDATSPIEVVGAWGTGSGTSITAPGVTTVSANSGLVMLAFSGDNNSYSSWSTPVNSSTAQSLASGNATEDVGTGLGFGIQAAVGASGSKSVTQANDPWAGILIALKPYTPVPVGCNGQYYISHGPISGANGNTLMKKLSFAGLTISPSVFNLNPGNIGYNAMGLNPQDGYIYAVRYHASGQKSRLLRIDANGNQVDLGAIAALANDDLVYAGCFDANGDFYFITQSDRLMKISHPVTSLTATQVGSTNNSFSTIYDIAINPVDGQMYGTNSSTTTNFLHTINKTTGALSSGYGASMGSSDFFAGLFFDEVGNLFGYRGDGAFFLINKTTAALTPAGSANAYDGADGCSCSSGRVFHDLDFTANPGNQVCPSQVNPNPSFPLAVTVTNQTSGQQTGLTYTLEIVDPLKRFRFTESAATIKANLIAAGLATNASVVTLSTLAPAVGTNYNKLVVTGFQTGPSNSALTFNLQVQLYSLGGNYVPVPLQSEITGLVAPFGPNDLSNDPGTITPDDATVITFCSNITLPVRLLSFTGTFKNNTTLLNWVAENQTSFAFYDIERSEDGTHFSNIAMKAAAGNPSDRVTYQHEDNLANTFGNTFYYRLRMVDVDGSFKYSNVVMIQRNEKSVSGISISPNPISVGSEATARISASTKGTIDLSVVDMAGRIVLTQQNKVNEGVNSIAIRNLERLQPGTYILKSNNNGVIELTKFTVVR